MRVLITGTSRGIGLEFTHRYLEAGHTVFALARSPESSHLKELQGKFSRRLVCVECDVADDASVAAARKAVEGKTEALDLVVNNAGTYGPDDDRLEKLNFADMRRVFEINIFGPIRVSREFLPLLKAGAQPKLVHITSLMGSLSDNRSGGKWSYRMSKAALNMANKNLALELSRHGIISVVLHPGWVRTDMGGPSAPLKVEDAVLSMVQTIARLTPASSGSFLDRNGKTAPW
jgi:NAD(P)-dependent dehydrogenase (short-subunit alcohol dehydrogenase family)